MNDPMPRRRGSRLIEGSEWNRGFDKLVPASDTTALLHVPLFIREATHKELANPIKFPALMMAYRLQSLCAKHASLQQKGKKYVEPS